MLKTAALPSFVDLAISFSPFSEDSAQEFNGFIYLGYFMTLGRSGSSKHILCRNILISLYPLKSILTIKAKSHRAAFRSQRRFVMHYHTYIRIILVSAKDQYTSNCSRKIHRSQSTINTAFAFISRENIGRILGIAPASALAATVSVVIIMDCLMTFMGSTSNDAAFNAWITDITDNSNRAKTEGMLATFPVLALVIVTVAFGILASSFGYPACFIGLGILVTVCGIIGLFTVKDSLSGEKKNTNFWADLIYGFRPSVIAGHRGLYLSLACFCILNVAVQIFMPYLFIYVQHQIGLDFGNLNITPPVAIVAVLVVGGVIAGAIVMGSLMDKYGRAPFSVPSVFLFAAGLVAVFFAKGLIVFAVCAIVALAGMGLM